MKHFLYGVWRNAKNVDGRILIINRCYCVVRNAVLVPGVRPAHVCPGHSAGVPGLEIPEMRNVCPADRRARVLFRLGLCRVSTQLLSDVHWFHQVSDRHNML